ncbi:glycosyltransferase [Vulcanococcus limneticus]|uniref:glycosyltransferase n=1 Tax=Vulcanococcus limneticus TaxID=2170428 RepID=UPI00398BD905
MSRVLLALHRIGPYHHVRLQTAATLLEIHALESRPRSQEYPWSFEPQGSYVIHQLSGQLQPEADPPLATLDQQLAALLNRLHPQVVVSVGWADRAYQRLLLAAQRRHIPVVIVSDSRERDEPRSNGKEAIKRQLLRGYSAALVAGRESRAYLEQLGFPQTAIFQPWDVVDTAFFAQTPRHAAQSPTTAAGPAGSHFLCVSRFVPKKHHAGLLAAYGRYQRQGGSWGLRLIGAGPLQADLEEAIARVPDPSRVQLHPFQQLSELAASYAQASAFVLASSSDQWGLVVNEAMAAGLPCLVSSACGCAADLIEHGRTGWCFDPASPEQLTSLMHGCERQSSTDRDAMVLAARRRLEAFSPEAFASGLRQAVEWALAHPRRSRRATLTAQLLSHRP